MGPPSLTPQKIHTLTLLHALLTSLPINSLPPPTRPAMVLIYQMDSAMRKTLGIKSQADPVS